MEMKPFLLSSPFFHLPFLSSLFLLPLLLQLLLWIPPHAYAQDVQPLYSICENTANYTNTSTFATNLRLLIPFLSTSASLNNGFFYTSAGNSSDMVYSLVLCRGDAAQALCQDCINKAGEDLMNECSNRSAIIWYDNCLLRYSNQNFFGNSSNQRLVYMWNTGNITAPGRFSMIAGRMLSDLSYKAAFEPWNLMYATAEADFFGIDSKIYGLVQCTRDISPTDCKSCLDSIVDEDVYEIFGKRGGRVLGPSCNVRYEVYSFFGPSTILAPAPPPPRSVSPPAPSINPSSSSNGTSMSTGGRRGSSTTIVIIVSTISATVILSIMFALLLIRKNHLRRRKPYMPVLDPLDGSDVSLQFDLSTIRVATDNFSEANKLGEGGFGPVYKGRLLDGQEIAVKRLSIYSGQGVEEFRNEIALIAKLQHRNLVRLFGCCMEGEEKLLIYEYIPNKSLDTFLFDPEKRTCLDWQRRCKIIGGIARGLLYLHEIHA